jgi:hypothetical protein
MKASIALRALAVALAALACAGVPLSAQTISGRVTDSAGIPVPRVRVMVHPASDSSEAATRIAFTNAQGEFTFRLPAALPYVVRVRRIGFAASPDQSVDLARRADATVSVALTAIPVELTTVRVAAVERRCLAIDDPGQTRAVRDAFEQSMAQIFARRVVERDFSFRIQLQRARTPTDHSPSAPMVFRHLAGARPDDWIEEDPANLSGIARAAALHGETHILPSEATLLYPTFRVNYCFENIFDAGADGTSILHFRERDKQSGQPSISGLLTFAADGLAIERAEFTFANGGRIAGTAHLAFARVSLDGESFPIVVERSVAQQTRKVRTQPSGVEERFAYSSFARVR